MSMFVVKSIVIQEVRLGIYQYTCKNVKIYFDIGDIGLDPKDP
jgi:hypothetical protein